MKVYTSPMITDFGDIVNLTAADTTVSETDTFITATGTQIGLEGPASQIVCVDSRPRDGICDHMQP